MRLFKGTQKHSNRLEPIAPRPAVEGPAEVRVARTVVKSEPEVEQLLASEPGLRAEGIEVTLAEKGFGTRVVIAASPASGLEESDLERFLDRLAEPQKRPFSNA